MITAASRRASARVLSRVFNIELNEVPAVVAGLGLFYLLFTGYFMLRPVRETMGIAGGVDNLQWLFTGTFIATLLAMPLFGWLASTVSRRHILPWVYGFFTLNLVLFAFAIETNPDAIWVGRTFYIWLSVFNLLAISLAWSVLADVFAANQAKRLFALIAGGASLGGLTGPLLGLGLVGSIGHAGLLILSAILLMLSAGCAMALRYWRDQAPQRVPAVEPTESEPHSERKLGGNPFSGATEAFRSPYLVGIMVFVLFLSSISTFLYFEQAKLVAETFPDPTRQTQIFSLIDTIVQTLSILTQVFLTGHIARRFGISVLLVAVPLIMAVGFLWLALAPVFAVLAVVMVVRRFGEYSLVRPGREMLYTVVPAEQKYKAKNFIDTVVYRGGDAVSGWVKRGIDLLADHPSMAMYLGSVLALGWAVCGLLLGRAQRQKESQLTDQTPS